MTGILKAAGLTKSFRNRIAVDDVSLDVSPGQVVGILGPNGAGKTTTFKLILGLLKQDRGTVSFGSSLDGLPLYRRARLGLGYLPQGASVFLGLTARQNLLAILEERGEAHPATRAESLLEEFGLSRLARQRARTLSGGERRRLAFALCLASSPKIILCDEPFAGIDPIAQEEIAQVIARQKKAGVGFLVTDHSVRETLRSCDVVHLLVEGRLVDTGTPEEILQSDTARRLYLGPRFT